MFSKDPFRRFALRYNLVAFQDNRQTFMVESAQLKPLRRKGRRTQLPLRRLKSQLPHRRHNAIIFSINSAKSSILDFSIDNAIR